MPEMKFDYRKIHELSQRRDRVRIGSRGLWGTLADCQLVREKCDQK
jgi:hypothetical protein